MMDLQKEKGNGLWQELAESPEKLQFTNGKNATFFGRVYARPFRAQMVTTSSCKHAK